MHLLLPGKAKTRIRHNYLNPNLITQLCENLLYAQKLSLFGFWMAEKITMDSLFLNNDKEFHKVQGILSKKGLLLFIVVETIIIIKCIIVCLTM